MEEPIFGTLATPELRLIHHEATHSGLQHRYSLEPHDPRPELPVVLTALAGPDLPVERMTCVYTTDRSEPAGEGGLPNTGKVAYFEPVGVEWDTLVWGYVSRWQAALPAQPEGTLVRYRISAWTSDGRKVIADWPDSRATIEAAARAYFRNQPLPVGFAGGDPSQGHTFNYRVDRLRPPDWARRAVTYHIFVDRFHPGQGRRWLQDSDLRALYGGTLGGVREHLDYIADLGATCLWLSPVFPSPSTHGYDATDLQRVEPRLGGDPALKALVDEAHARGMSVVLDLMCNHVSNQHPYFREAQASLGSPRREWFRFDDSPVGYRSYFGVGAMPEVNLEHPAAREWMVEVGRYWLREFEVDGYRLDHAQGPGPGFWAEFWAACKAQSPDCFCFGEVVEPPDVQRQYVGRMDGLLDFQFAYAVRQALARGRWTSDRLTRFLVDHPAFFPDDDFLLLTFLDNHDMDRFLFVAGNQPDVLRRAAELQMQRASPPVVYYGTEVGMTQDGSKVCLRGLEPSRLPMIWDERQDRALLQFYKDLIRRRQELRPWESQSAPASNGSRP